MKRHGLQLYRQLPRGVPREVRERHLKFPTAQVSVALSAPLPKTIPVKFSSRFGRSAERGDQRFTTTHPTRSLRSLVCTARCARHQDLARSLRSLAADAEASLRSFPCHVNTNGAFQNLITTGVQTRSNQQTARARANSE